MTPPSWWYRDVFHEDAGADVKVAQLKLGTQATGHMNAETVARIRGFQRLHALPITGVIDAPTAAALGESATRGLVPAWFGPPVDFEGLRAALHLSPWEDLDNAIRRFQSSHRRYPDGRVDTQLAIEIGDA